MRLYVLGSGSRGNCCAVECEGAVLFIDAGFSAKEIERRAERVGLSLSHVIGIALTHEHGDHASGAGTLARRHRAPVLTASATWTSLADDMGRATHRPIGACARAELGPFTVSACPTSHDAVEPLAIAVHATDGASLGVAYDLGRPTAAIRWLLRDLSAVVLEANHDEVLLRTSSYPPSVQERIAGSGGHLSNRAAAELLNDVYHPGLGVVVLAHLSQRCNTADDARAAIEPPLRARGFRGELHVALQDDPLPPLDVVDLAETRSQLGLGLS